MLLKMFSRLSALCFHFCIVCRNSYSATTQLNEKEGVSTIFISSQCVLYCYKWRKNYVHYDGESLYMIKHYINARFISVPAIPSVDAIESSISENEKTKELFISS